MIGHSASLIIQERQKQNCKEMLFGTWEDNYDLKQGNTSVGQGAEEGAVSHSVGGNVTGAAVRETNMEILVENRTST